MKVRIATFNVENLFARFKFNGGVSSEDAVSNGWTAEQMHFVGFKENKRKLTAKAIKSLKPDILCLQEVESMHALRKFNTKYLGGKYRYKMLIDSTDPRFIDVALLSKFPILNVRSYMHRRTEDRRAYVFSRDCLEVNVSIPSEKKQGKYIYGNKTLPLYINHFKSMFDRNDPANGRQNTMAKREKQSKAVVDIIKARFGDDPGQFDWVVLGDLNDYRPSPGLQPLLGQPWLEDVIKRLPAEDRWTHYWSAKKQYRQLDYLLLSRSLAAKNPGAVPEIERRGLPKRALKVTEARFAGVGDNQPKASDHCPMMIELEL